jgi:hypothetical protein
MVAFQIVQTLYWLALSTWFGGVLFIAIAAPIIFRVVREANPILPHVLAANLEGAHGSLLAGSIVGELLRTLSNIQFACAAVLMLMLVGQWLVMGPGDLNRWQAVIRSCLFVAAVVLNVYDRRFVAPKAFRFRQEYIDHADEPEVANAAKEQFDHYHRESVRVLFIIVVVLSLMVVFSTYVMP